MRVCLQSADMSPKICVKKNTEFFYAVWIPWKILYEKGYYQKRDRNMLFFTYTFVQTGFANNFVLVFLKNFLRIWKQREILCFLIPFMNLKKDI